MPPPVSRGKRRQRETPEPSNDFRGIQVYLRSADLLPIDPLVRVGRGERQVCSDRHDHDRNRSGRDDWRNLAIERLVHPEIAEADSHSNNDGEDYCHKRDYDEERPLQQTLHRYLPFSTGSRPGSSFSLTFDLTRLAHI